MKEPVHFLVDESFYDTSYTYAFDKYSCVSWMYPIHIITAYLVVLTGFLAILSRVVNKLRPHHAAFGRWYIICMLWCMATSLLIHNTGLPMPILVSFVYMLVSITVGWNVIRVHVDSVAALVKEKVNLRINEYLGNKDQSRQINIEEMQSEEKGAILTAKSFRERIFSTKMLHGLLMTFSWAQMLGRTVVTNPFTSFSYGCWTYPAYKSIDGTTVGVDGQATPGFPMENSTFLVVITVPTVLIVLTVAFLVTYCYYRQEKGKVLEISTVSPPNSQALNNA